MVNKNGMLRFEERVQVPWVSELKEEIGKKKIEVVDIFLNVCTS